MENVNKKVIVIAFVMAIFTTAIIYNYIKSLGVKEETQKTVAIIVANKNLPEKHKIVEEDLRVEQVVESAVNKNAAKEKSEILGKRVLEKILEGEQIVKARVLDGKGFELTYNVPENKRAVSVNINEQIGVSNLIRPGDFVDVIASFDKEEIDMGKDKLVMPKITKTIIQNVLVLAIASEQIVTEDKSKEPPKTVTLAVNTQDAERLVYASDFGSIRMALRSVGDGKVSDSQGIIREDITLNKGAKVLPK